MGTKGSHRHNGAKGPGPDLDLGALARLGDKELVAAMEDERLQALQEQAKDLAPKAMGWLEDVGSDRFASPASRVSAAREVLHQAIGRPAQQRDTEGPRGTQLTVNIQEFKVDAPPLQREQLVEVEEVEVDLSQTVELELEDF